MIQVKLIVSRKESSGKTVDHPVQAKSENPLIKSHKSLRNPFSHYELYSYTIAVFFYFLLSLLLLPLLSFSFYNLSFPLLHILRQVIPYHMANSPGAIHFYERKKKEKKISTLFLCQLHDCKKSNICKHLCIN